MSVFQWFLLICRDRFNVEKIPTLQEAVEECIRHQLTIFFDVKGQPDMVLHTLSANLTGLWIHYSTYIQGSRRKEKNYTLAELMQ